MVLKKCPAGYNTGGSIRAKVLRDVRRFLDKRIVVSNGKNVPSQHDYYYNEYRQCEKLLDKMIERLSDQSLLASAVQGTIIELVDYFIDLEYDLILNQHSYIPNDSDGGIASEILDKIHILKGFQEEIDNGSIDTGHDCKSALRITVTHNVKNNYVDDTVVHEFRTYRDDRARYEKHIKHSHEYWERMWHNEHFRGVQRDTELRRVQQRRHKQHALHQIGWQENAYDDEFAHYVDIHIVITEPKPPTRIKSQNFKSFEPLKLSKKMKGEKVKHQSYWNNLDPKEIQDAILIRSNARSRYLARKRANQNRKMHKHKKKKVIEKPEIYIPVGLQPKEAGIYRQKMEKRARKMVNERNSLHKVEDTKKQKEKMNEAKMKKSASESKKNNAFITSVPTHEELCNPIERRMSMVPLTENKPVKSKVKLEKEKIDKLNLWEFIEDLEQIERNEKSQIIFKQCLKHKDVTIQSQTVNEHANRNVNLRHSNTSQKPKSSSHGVQWQLEQNGMEKKRKNGRKRKREKTKLENLINKDAIIPKENSDKNILNTTTKRKESLDTKQSVSEMSPTKSILKETPYSKLMETPDISDTKFLRICEKLEKFSDVAMPPIAVVVKSSSLRPSYLNKTYGTYYQEGNVFPRMFSLDISDKVKDTVKMFRKLDEPFTEPMCMLLVEAPYNKADGIRNDNNISLTHIKLHLKADMSPESLIELHSRMKEKVNIQLIYPFTKIIEYFVQMFKTLSFTSYVGAELISRPGLEADERTRSELDWLLALCQWKYLAYTASEAYLIFNNTTHTLDVPRPTTSGICRIIEKISSQLSTDCNKLQCERAAVIRLLPCQHAFCRQCLSSDVINAVSRQENPLSCPVIGCKTVLDPVSQLFALSLPQHKLYGIQQQTQRIAAHPLWQWCPKATCGRVVKLGGAGFLDNTVAIMCDCGANWCFHCLREGHWPAPCPQAANYMDNMRLESATNTTSQKAHQCEISHITCSNCLENEKTRKGSLAGDEGDMNESGMEMERTCNCRYEMCRACVDSDNTALAIPPSLISRKGLSKEACRCVVVGLLYYRRALEHRTEKMLWNWSTVEIRASTILQKIKRSASVRVKSSHPDTEQAMSMRNMTSQSDAFFQPTPPPRLHTVRNKSLIQLPKSTSFFNRPTTSQPVITPKQDAEKFFLVTVQQFVHQSHVLLEYVYVYMMDGSLLRKSPDIIHHVLKLEGVIQKITKIVSSAHCSSRNILEELYRLHENGNQTMKNMTLLLQNTNCTPTVAFRTPTFFKTGFSKLPPIGQKALTSHSDY